MEEPLQMHSFYVEKWSRFAAGMEEGCRSPPCPSSFVGSWWSIYSLQQQKCREQLVGIQFITGQFKGMLTVAKTMSVLHAHTTWHSASARGGCYSRLKAAVNADTLQQHCNKVFGVISLSLLKERDAVVCLHVILLLISGY